MVESLRGRFNLYAFSNTNPLHHKFLLDEFNLLQCMDDCAVSYLLGVAKPSPEAFKRASNQLLDDGEELVLYIDDNSNNVRAARHHGWPAVVCESIPQVEAFMREQGIVE
ncbi:HAD family hydrolase [Candidatus Hydrogenedentota bacterium]